MVRCIVYQPTLIMTVTREVILPVSLSTFLPKPMNLRDDVSMP